jgi:putative xylitol transport system permease protein
MASDVNSQAVTVNIAKGHHIARSLSKYGIVIAFFAICLILSFLSENFLTEGNIFNVLRQTSVNGILAVGMTFVVLTGGIDLSVGSILAFASIVSAGVVSGTMPHNPALAIGIGLGIGTLMGVVNGSVSAWLAVPPFITTLGMLSVARGLTFIYTDGMPVPNLSPAFRSIGLSYLFGVPVPVIIFLAVTGLAWFVLRRTVYGRYVYAVGGNERSAKTSGIATKRVIMSVYAISGFMCGLAGLILTARTSSALPQAGVSYELDAIGAVVIGGTSLSGGVGSIVGSFFGALIIGVINNGLDLLGVSSYYQQVIKGLIIVGAVLLDVSRRK